MSEFVFDLQRFAKSTGGKTGFDALESMHNIIQKFDLKTVDGTKLQDGSSTLNSTLKFIGTFFGSLFFKKSTRTAEVNALTTILGGIVSLVEDAYAIREENAKDKPSKVVIASKAEDFISKLTSLTNAFKKLTGGKNSFILSVVSAAIGLTSNLVLSMDGLKDSEIKKINNSYIALVQVSGAEIIKKFFSEGLADKLIDKPVNQILEIPGIREELGKQFTKGSGPLGLIFAAISGVLNGANKYDSNFKKYTEDGIPKDIAKHDATIDALATFIHDTASYYAKGFDDTVFKLIQAGLSFVRGKDIPYYTDKNYVETIADWIKTLNYKNSGTSGNDKFYVLESKSMVYGDSGNDEIGNYGFSNVTIWGGHGDDILGSYNTDSATPKKNSIVGGPGDDSISVYDVKSTIYGGTGKDFINVVGTNNELFGDAGDDEFYIANGANNNTISGDKGNDFIVMQNNAKNTLIKYSSGDGNDTIYGFNEDDTIKISGSYKTSASGNDFLITAGKGSIKLIGMAGKDININDKTYKRGKEDPTATPVPPPVFPTLPATVASTIIRGTKGDDTITNTLKSAIILALDGNDSIENHKYWDIKLQKYVGGYSVTIDGGKGNDSIHNSAFEVTINGGDGDDFIYNDCGHNISIDGGAGNDYIFNWGDRDGSWYSRWNSCILTINSGAGNDDICSNGSSITIDSGSGDDYIYNSGSSVTIDGGAGNDSVYNYWRHSDCTINTGEGNDLISLDSYSHYNVIIYNSGDGKDTIYGFDGDDTLSIGGGKGTYSTTESGSDIIVTVGKGKISLIGAASLYKVNIDGVYNDPTILNVTNSTKSPVTVGSAVKFIDASARTKAVQITGNSRSNTILGGSKSDSIYGGAGKDSLVGNAGSDKLFGDTGNDSIFGGSGNDCLVGGKGNDSLWGDAGADTFIYAKGDGKDIIYGFDSKDTLTFDNITFKTSMASYDKSKGTLTFNVSGGSVTLKDFTTSTFHINNNIYKLSNGTFKKQ